MLKITGVLALLLSTALVLLFAFGVRTVRAQGRFSNTMNPHSPASPSNQSELVLSIAGGTRDLLEENTPGDPWSTCRGTNGDFIVFVYIPFSALPKECDLEFSHHWVRLAGQTFIATSLRYEGRTYPIDRSPAVFFGILALVALAPAILWGAIAGCLWIPRLREDRR